MYNISHVRVTYESYLHICTISSIYEQSSRWFSMHTPYAWTDLMRHDNSGSTFAVTEFPANLCAAEMSTCRSRHVIHTNCLGLMTWMYPERYWEWFFFKTNFDCLICKNIMPSLWGWCEVVIVKRLKARVVDSGMMIGWTKALYLDLWQQGIKPLSSESLRAV